MRITALHLHSIAIADPPLRSSYGLHAPWALRTIVELETDEGLTRHQRDLWRRGSASGAGSRARSRRRHAIRFNSPALNRGDADRTGSHSGKLPAVAARLYLVPGENPLDRHNRTYAALEIACLDIIGKAVGRPVCDVIGGRVRDRVPFSAYLFYKHGGRRRGRPIRGRIRRSAGSARRGARVPADDRRNTASERSS